MINKEQLDRTDAVDNLLTTLSGLYDKIAAFPTNPMPAIMDSARPNDGFAPLIVTNKYNQARGIGPKNVEVLALGVTIPENRPVQLAKGYIRVLGKVYSLIDFKEYQLNENLSQYVQVQPAEEGEKIESLSDVLIRNNDLWRLLNMTTVNDALLRVKYIGNKSAEQ